MGAEASNSDFVQSQRASDISLMCTICIEAILGNSHCWLAYTNNRR